LRARQAQRQLPGLTCQLARREPVGLGQTGPEQAVQRHPDHPQLQGLAGHPGPARPTPQLLPTWLHPQLELTQP
jgi:hypothetical protein